MIHKGKIVNLRIDAVELPNGKTATREVVEHMGAVAVVPLTDDGDILMVKQYRHPVGKILLEIPAGKLDPGEDPQHCVERELLEETGMMAGECKLLFSIYTSPGFSNEILHIYLAKNLTYKGQQLDEDEFVEIEKINLDKAVEMIYSGEINDAKTIAGIVAVKQLI